MIRVFFKFSSFTVLFLRFRLCVQVLQLTFRICVRRRPEVGKRQGRYWDGLLFLARFTLHRLASFSSVALSESFFYFDPEISAIGRLIYDAMDYHGTSDKQIARSRVKALVQFGCSLH